MKEKDINNSFSKVCGVAYNFQDVKNVIMFCQKHNYNWFYITHNDSDELSDNSIKRHYHFIIESDSRHRFNIKSLLNDNFKINLFLKLDSVKSYLRYMTHIDYDLKKHYDIRFIKSNLSQDKISQLVNDLSKNKTELTDENFKQVMLYIFECSDNGLSLTLKDVIRYCFDNNYTYKSSWSFTIINLLKLL